MEFQLNKNSFVIFDLDDTLYLEVDFLKSAFLEIAGLFNRDNPTELMLSMFSDYTLGIDVFFKLEKIYQQSNFKKSDLITLYRNHVPAISFTKNADLFIDYLKERNVEMGLLTDGRSITQRNKIKSLGLSKILSEIIISEEFGSEKPNLNNFLHFVKKFPKKEFTYIADNTTKDFITPCEIGWQLVCILNDGNNIHNQELSLLPKTTIIIKDFMDLSKSINRSTVY